ncbi:HalOD1 output domain-containing protein [Haloprofundus salilacus]|uniref:HalOD1 output domain-containing protein n=1 Tax=Haloprofundus salilacus TaxID=2876190 RepID=UPI001CCCB7BA|nr:HalOD1 output domain-containing protein [Haloprofundus salilacus]
MVGEVESTEHSSAERGVSTDKHANDAPGTSEAWYQPSDSFDLSVTIVGAVAEAAGTDLLNNEFTPLYHSIDIDALETTLFDPDSNRSRSVRGEIAFDYEGFEVAVRTDGRISVSAQD